MYQHIANCNVHSRHPFNEKKQCRLCEASTYAILTETLYTRKHLVIMELSIVDFRQQFYIPAIHKLAFHLTCVRIIGTHHCGNTRQEVFKCRAVYQYELCRRDYAEHVVSIFAHQIQY